MRPWPLGLLSLLSCLNGIIFGTKITDCTETLGQDESRNDGIDSGAASLLPYYTSEAPSDNVHSFHISEPVENESAACSANSANSAFYSDTFIGNGNLPVIDKEEELTMDKVISILKVHSDKSFPQTTPANSIELVRIIVDNFVLGHLFPSDNDDSDEEQHGIEILNLNYNASVLENLKFQPRILNLLGLEGCVQIVQKALYVIDAKLLVFKKRKHAIKRLRNAVGKLEEFFRFAMEEMPVPTDYASVSLEYQAFVSIAHPLSFGTLARTNAKRFLGIILSRFRSCIPADHYSFLLDQLRPYFSAFQYTSLRFIVTDLVKLDDRRALTDPALMHLHYSALTPQFFMESTGRKALSRQQVYAKTYLYLCPVLRALMMLDSCTEIREYLFAFADVAKPNRLAAESFGPLLRILDEMIVDAGFLRLAQSNLDMAREIFAYLDDIFDWDWTDMLFIAICRGLKHVTEAFLMLHPGFDYFNCVELARTAVYNHRRADSVEIVALVLAYCSFDFAELTKLVCINCVSLSVDSPLPQWKRGALSEYNREVIGEHLMLQMAAVMEMFSHICDKPRDLQALNANERIAFPCPPEIFDSLHPKLLGMNGSNLMKADDNSNYPHYMILSVAQFILFRMFGIRFAHSRPVEDIHDAPEWCEIIGFMNAIIEQEAQVKGITGPLVTFYDPIAEKLKPLNLDGTQYAFHYRAAAKIHFKTQNVALRPNQSL